MLCAKCRQSNPAQARFCNQCGAALAAAAAPELRRLTVVFCDLAGSVELASRLDPEDWHALLGTYQAAAGAAIRQRHGYVAQHLGDGLVAYFGYPVAGEDDAVRAVLAALEVVREVSRLAIPGGGQLRVRVGVHTGMTVMGHAGGNQGDYLAMGETPNLAARLQAAAAPNTVVLSQATRTLVEARVRCADLGEHVAKGVAAPLRLFQALGPRSREGGEVATPREPAPFLGRQQELERLAAAWDRAGGAAGHCVLLRGEPGIGKSRLARQLRARVAAEGEALLMRCSAHMVNTPFAPLVQLLRGGMASAGLPADSAASLSTLLATAGITDEAELGPLREMMALAAPGAAEAPAVSAQAMRERTFAAATSLLRAVAARGRVLLIMEDLHWADPSTLEWLGRLLRRDLPGGLLLLLLTRPEFAPRWAASPRVEPLMLEPCSADEAAALVAALDPQHALGQGAVTRIVERAEGNPLFVQEFTRSALEALDEDIPLTLQEQTMARLDRLGAAKHVLQQASIIGRHFSLRQLCVVSGLGEAAVHAALRRGVEAHMLRPLAAADRQFAFHHALLRDAAYSSLLRSARQAGHARVAAALLADEPALAGRQPELLAHHYTEAGLLAQAIDHWVAAARLALLRSASVEATAHARTALRLLGDPGDDEAALATELELQLVLGPALMATRGMLDPQVEQTYARARLLCMRLGDANRLLVPLWGLWAYELMRGEVDASWEATRQLQVLADAGQPAVAPLVVAATGGMTLFYRGDFTAARDACAKGLGQARLSDAADRSVRGFHDPGVMCLAFHNLASWLLGDAAAATTGAASLRALIPTLAPFDAAYACCADAVLHTLAGDAAAARGASARAMAVSKEQAFPAWLMMGSLMDGWGRARQGEGAPALAQMRTAFEAWCRSGARNLRPFFLGLLADASLAAGDAAEAARCAQAGLAEAASGEHWWDAELHRLHAEALALQGDHAGALRDARLARELALRCGARAWQQRAEATLARLALHDQAAA